MEKLIKDKKLWEVLAEENTDLVKQFDITQAPTLVITDGVSYDKYQGAGAIRGFLINKEA